MSTEYQIESGVCNGRGFSHVDATGYCKLFKDWVVKSVVAGGPGWYLLDDQTSTSRDPVAGNLTNSGLGNYTAANCVDNSVTTKAFDVDSASGGEYLDIDYGVGVTREIVKLRMYMDAAGSTSSWTVQYSDNGSDWTSADTGLVPSVAGWNFFEWTSGGAHRYWKLLLENAPGAGADVMELEFYDDTIVTNPYIVVSDTQNPAVNDQAMWVKVGYVTSEAGYVRAQYYLGWNQMTHTGYGLWSGYRMVTVDAGDFAYVFRGGPRVSDHRCLVLQTRSGSTRYVSVIDGWTGSSTFVEPTTTIGVLQAGITAGSDVVLQLDTGEATNFTEDKWYYIYDFANHTWVDYVQCTDVDTGTDQITVDALAQNFPAGTVIGAYPHRFYTCGNGTHSSTNDINQSGFKTPYVSYPLPTYCFHDGIGYIYGECYGDCAQYSLTRAHPNDELQYAIQNPFIVERYIENYDHFSTGSTTSMNRSYGCTNNLYVSYYGTMVEDLDGITFSGDNWIYVGSSSSYINLSSTMAILLLDTEHTS